MEVANREHAEAFTTLDGSTIRVLLDARAGGAVEQSLAEATLAPGESTRRHYHARTEEIYVVLEGSGELEVEGERADVGPGDAVLIPPGARHQIRAAGEGELRFLCCCAPQYSDEDTFLE
ncbi:MAG TPA: cupin domain-containing protein [Gaiellaceae bacterium]|nr:cupin domain-containing protein [Gaiellaceae bacterium]